MAISPIFLRMRSNSAIGLAELLALAYFTPISRMCFAPPVAPTPSFQRA